MSSSRGIMASLLSALGGPAVKKPAPPCLIQGFLSSPPPPQEQQCSTEHSLVNTNWRCYLSLDACFKREL